MASATFALRGWTVTVRRPDMTNMYMHNMLQMYLSTN